MFAGYLDDFDTVLDEAKESPHVKVEKYKSVKMAILSYAKKHKLIISEHPDQYVLYGDHIFRHANDLSNILADLIFSVVLFTTEKNMDFTILVDGLRMVQLYNIHRKLKQALAPIVKNGQMYCPPEFELIDVYHKMYMPVHASEWCELSVREIELRKQIIPRKEIIKGAYQSVFFKWIRSQQNCIFVGDAAIKILQDQHPSHIQFISANVESTIKQIENLMGKINVDVRVKTRSMMLHIEPRLRRTTITANGKHLCDIFNNAEFDLVPYQERKSMRIATRPVRNMLLMVDLHALRTVHALGFVQNIDQKVNQIFNLLDKSDKHRCNLFSHIGIYSDVQRYKQKKGTANEFFPYVPAQYKHQKNEYRIIH